MTHKFKVGDRVKRCGDYVGSWALGTKVVVVSAITDYGLKFDGMSFSWYPDYFELASETNEADAIEYLKNLGYNIEAPKDIYINVWVNNYTKELYSFAYTDKYVADQNAKLVEYAIVKYRLKLSSNKVEFIT